MDWIVKNYIEIFGALTALVYIFLEMKQNPWLWPLGIVSSGVYTVVFYNAGFYADMVLQLYFVAISVYGWWAWKHRKIGGTQAGLVVTRVSKNLTIKIAAIGLFLWYAIYWVLKYQTPSTIPVGDAFITAFSIVATWMLARKKLEQWLVWVIVNGVSLGMYFYKGLYPTAILFVLYTVLSVKGYYNWKHSMIKQQNNESTAV